MINFIKKIFTNRDNSYQEEIGTDLLPAETISVEDVNDIVKENFDSTPIIFDESLLSKEFISHADLGFYFYSWQVKEGEWIDKGRPLFEVCWSDNLYSIGNNKSSNPSFWSAKVVVAKSGVVEYIKKSGDKIKSGDIIGYIHSVGIFKDENSVTNDTYSYYFNKCKFDFSKYFPDEYLYESTVLYDYKGLLINFWININTVSWFKKNFDFVKKGDLIFSIEFENSSFIFNYSVVTKGSIFKNGVMHHYAEKDGYIDIGKNVNEGFNDLNQSMYKIHSDFNQLLKQKFQNQPSIQIDEFNDSVKINWKVVGGYEDHYEIASDTTIGGVILNTDDGRSFIFSFEFYEGKDYLVFYYSIKDFKISIGNKISFLFEDNIKHTFNVIEKPIRCKIIGSKLYETKVQITSDELKSFSSKNLLKWKIEDPINNTSFICEAKNHYWYTKDLLQAVTKNLASEYTNLVLENDINYSPLIERNELKIVSRDNNEECYVYLMIDTTNNFHKIGISNNPKYREKTLQSDKPTIELLHKKSFPNRKIAEVLEKTLHITYSNKRIRGEWFDLDDNEINEVIIMLN
jgi:hypothetical protein